MSLDEGRPVRVVRQWRGRPVGGGAVAAPVQNQWYSLFTEGDVRVLYVAAEQTNAAAANMTLQVRFNTRDGVLDGPTNQVAVDSTVYYCYLNPVRASVVWSAVAVPAGLGSVIHARSLNIQLRTTSAGLDDHMDLYVRYEQL